MIRRRVLLAILGGAALLCVAVPAFAATLGVSSSRLTGWQSATTVVTCSGSTQTASANADSWLDQSSPTTNKGTDAINKVRSSSGSANFRTISRFTLPAVPAGCTVTSAKLRLYAASATSGRTLQALQVAAAWTEGAVTWGNQPATTGTAATVASGLGWREWTVTAQVQSMYSGTNNGFLVRDATENGGGPEQSFHAREKAPDNPPELVITFG